MMGERVESWLRGFEWCIFDTQKFWSCNKFYKMKCLCNKWFLVWNTDISKEIVQFVHEVHPVFVVTLSTFLHMLCGWNDDTMPTFNLFRVHLLWFSIWGLFSSKQIIKCMKNNKWCQKWLKVDDVALNGLYWTQEKSGVVISLKKWNTFVTYEFWSETLILRKRLPSLYTKCVQFLS